MQSATYASQSPKESESENKDFHSAFWTGPSWVIIPQCVVA